MSKLFDNIETKFEEGLHAILTNVGVERAGLLKVGVMSFKSPKEASELTVNGARVCLCASRNGEL